MKDDDRQRHTPEWGSGSLQAFEAVRRSFESNLRNQFGLA